MTRHVEAIFSDGAFRPLEPLALPEGTRVHLSVEAEPMTSPILPEAKVNSPKLVHSNDEADFVMEVREGHDAGEDARGQKEVAFGRLVSEWRQQRSKYSDDPAHAVLSPAYLKIIGMGPEVIPWILAEMKHGTEPWFWALQALTDANPVRPEHRGRFREMAADWIEWGKSNGFVAS
jgi:predicted DNA-binding antitoxin AbrB/MazE fold protein